LAVPSQTNSLLVEAINQRLIKSPKPSNDLACAHCHSERKTQCRFARSTAVLNTQSCKVRRPSH
jgi:hypothetical protein